MCDQLPLAGIGAQGDEARIGQGRRQGPFLGEVHLLGQILRSLTSRWRESDVPPASAGGTHHGVLDDGHAGWDRRIRHLGGIAPSWLNIHSAANQRPHRKPATTTR